MTRGHAGQLLRRVCQLGVVCFVVYAALGGAFRNYKLAHNHRRIVALIEGELWGTLYGLNEDLLALGGDVFEQSLDFLGFPWAARIFGIDAADPLLVASFVLRTGELRPGLLLALVLPLGLAVLFGKLFCSHLCPMRLCFEIGAAMRRGLGRLGLSLPSWSPDVRLGGFVLLGGLSASALGGTAVWLLVLPYASFSVAVFAAITSGTVVGVLAVVVGWLLLDVGLSPGFFCRSVCPTGFLLEQLGRRAPFGLMVARDRSCPTGCHACKRACPYGLSPRDEAHRPACDACGRCVVACPSQRLRRGVSLPVLTTVALAVWASPQLAHAHHNKGLPHYGYFENYPQVPTEEYVAIHGRWEIGATVFNFQGLDRRTADTPNDVKIYLYLYDLRARQAYAGPLSVELRLDGEVVSRFDRVEVDEEAVYSTRETLPEGGDYELVALVGAERVVLPFHVELDTGVDWPVVAGLTFPALLVFGLALVGRRRRRRRRRGAVAVAAVLLLSWASPLAAGLAHAEAPGAAEQAVCPHCGMVGCTMDHGGAAATAAVAPMVHYRTPDGGMVMVMGGIPLGVFLFGVAAVIAVSFAVVEWRGVSLPSATRLNLIRKPRVYDLVRSRWFQAVPQLFMLSLLALLVYVGLFGSRVANLTPVAVWTLWWAGLIFTVLLLGSAWCFVCPWDGLANLASRLRAVARVDTLSLSLPYPKALANMYPAIGLFALLTWLELGFGVTTDPRFTAYMGLGMAALAVVAALLWDGKRFCAHMCPVGRICGIYGNFSPIEIRARNKNVCQRCTTEDCLHGNAEGYACPTGISLKTVQRATDCTACTECVKSCDKRNVAINLRPFGADLMAPTRVRTDEAWLALILLSLTLFHGLSMTPAWESFEPGGSSLVKWIMLSFGMPRIASFSVAMLAVVAVPIVVYWAACALAARWAGQGVGVRELFVAYAFSLLPVALFYHLAHNLMHLLMEGGHVVPLLSDPMGDGSNYFGTRGLHVGSLASDQALWLMQVGLIVVGHIYGIVVAHRVGHRIYGQARGAARRSLIPIPAMMVALSICGLWLMHMDMNMRVGRM